MDGAEGMRVRIEVEYDDGTRNIFQFEGNITREKLMRCLEMIDLETIPHPSAHEEEHRYSLIKQLEYFLRITYPRRWFTSSDVKDAFAKTHGIDIKPTTLSTYLARMYEENILERRGGRRQWQYRVNEEYYENTGENFLSEEEILER